MENMVRVLVGKQLYLIRLSECLAAAHPTAEMPAAEPPHDAAGAEAVARPAPSPSPYFVPGSPHVMLIELGQAIVWYQDQHMLCLLS